MVGDEEYAEYQEYLDQKKEETTYLTNSSMNG